MNKPDPSKSRIDSAFSARWNSMIKVDALEHLKQVGELMFKPEDIYAERHLLDILIRKIFVSEHITDKYFKMKYKQYACNVLGMMPNQANNNLANLEKALKAGKISFKRFIEATVYVLNYKIRNFGIQLDDEHGVSLDFSILDDIANVCDDEQTIAASTPKDTVITKKHDSDEVMKMFKKQRKAAKQLKHSL